MCLFRAIGPDFQPMASLPFPHFHIRCRSLVVYYLKYLLVNLHYSQVRSTFAETMPL